MKHLLLFIIILQVNASSIAQQPNAIATSRIKTPWAEKVSIDNPHPEYPRPQMVRNNNWFSLNGQWDYAIQPRINSSLQRFERKILAEFI